MTSRSSLHCKPTSEEISDGYFVTYKYKAEDPTLVRVLKTHLLSCTALGKQAKTGLRMQVGWIAIRETPYRKWSINQAGNPVARFSEVT